MISVLFGLVCLAFAGYAVLPFSRGLGWTEEFIFVLKGFLPICAIGLGFLCVLIGLVDIIDRKHALEEARLQKELEEQESASAS